MRLRGRRCTSPAARWDPTILREGRRLRLDARAGVEPAILEACACRDGRTRSRARPNRVVEPQGGPGRRQEPNWRTSVVAAQPWRATSAPGDRRARSRTRARRLRTRLRGALCSRGGVQSGLEPERSPAIRWRTRRSTMVDHQPPGTFAYRYEASRTALLEALHSSWRRPRSIPAWRRERGMRVDPAFRARRRGLSRLASRAPRWVRPEHVYACHLGLPDPPSSPLRDDQPPAPRQRTWTFAYGKTCADDRGDLEAWAIAVGGRPTQPCRSSLPLMDEGPYLDRMACLTV